MAIHYSNHNAFSKGQGFIGAACRPISAQATTARWFACDCAACKMTLLSKRIISRQGETGLIREVYADRVNVAMVGGGVTLRTINFRELDREWAPLDLDEIFGMKPHAGDGDTVTMITPSAARFFVDAEFGAKGDDE